MLVIIRLISVDGPLVHLGRIVPLFVIWLLERGSSFARPNIRAHTDGPARETHTWRTAHRIGLGKIETGSPSRSSRASRGGAEGAVPDRDLTSLRGVPRRPDLAAASELRRQDGAGEVLERIADAAVVWAPAGFSQGLHRRRHGSGDPEADRDAAKEDSSPRRAGRAGRRPPPYTWSS
jgi:hypothetical protein